MADHATIYAPMRLLPGERHLAPFAPGARIAVEEKASRVQLAWDDLRITLARMAEAEMPAHLEGLQGYVRKNGGGEVLATRVLSTLSVYGFTIEPGFDGEGRAMRLLGGINSACDGLCFLDGDLLDRTGRSLFAEPLAAPAAERVAARALCLLALSMRGLLDQDAGRPDEAKANALRGDVVKWIDRHPNIAAELEEEERALLETPIGGADRQAIVNAVWRAEGAQVLLWALGARALPAHDAQEHPFHVAKACGVLGETKLFEAKLRSSEEIEHMRVTLLAIHWRLVEARIAPHKPFDIATLAETGFLAGADLSGVPRLAGDLPIRGVPVARAADEHRQLAESIARERHHAANWLVGSHPVYSQVDTPT